MPILGSTLMAPSLSSAYIVPHRDTSFGLGSPHVLRAFKRPYEYNHLRKFPQQPAEKKNIV